MTLLRRILECSPDEDDREELILAAVTEAHKIGLKCGFAAVSRSQQVLRAFIELPGAGQVSWPVDCYPKTWESQSPEERKRRVLAWTRQEPRIARTLFD